MKEFLRFFYMSALLFLGGVADASGIHDIRSVELKNGLKVYVIPDHRLPVVMQILIYKVGGVDDPRGLSGMAHYFEHLMFSGTDRFPEFSETIDGVGGQFNAGTGRELTVYYELVNKQYLPLIMSMEADRMQNLRPTDRDIERERGIVREERSMRVESTLRDIIREEIESAFFYKNGYGTSVAGWEHEMENYSRESIDSFYNEHYSPNNAILLIAGDVDFTQVTRLAEKYYGSIPNRNKSDGRKFPVKVEPPHKSDIIVKMAHPTVSYPESWVLYKAPSLKTSPDLKTRGAAAIAADIVGGDGFGVLYDELVKEKQSAIGVSASYMDENGMVVLSIDQKLDASPEELHKEVKNIIAKLKKEGVSEEQVQSAKYRHMASLMYVLDGMEKAWFYAGMLAFGVELQSPNEVMETLKSITVDDVNQAMKSIFSGATVEGYLVHKDDEEPEDSKQAQSLDETSVGETL